MMYSIHHETELEKRGTDAYRAPLSQCQIQVLDRFVDLRRVLIPDCNAVDARVLKRESHCRLAVLPVERTLAHKFHADYAHSFFSYLLDLGDNFRDVTQSASVVILGV